MKPNSAAGYAGGLSPKQQLVMANGMLRKNILENCPRVDRQISTGTQGQTTYTATPIGQPVIPIIPQNFGLLTDFFIEFTATYANTTTGTATPSPFGAPAMLQQIQFYDLNNVIRHQTNGIFLQAVDSVKSRRPYGSAFKASSNDNTFGYGANYSTGVCSQTASISAGGVGTVKWIVRVPIAYAPDDLRGGILAQVTNANMLLNLTMNTTGAAATGDNTLNPYALTGTISANTTVPMIGLTTVVYQRCYDQIPQYKSGQQAGQYQVPLLDQSTIYEIKQIVTPAIVQGQDNLTAYANFRSFLNTMFIYDQNGTLNAGTDISFIAVRTASAYDVMKVDPYLLSLWSRQELGFDWPAGMYQVPSRERPINTLQFGNMNLVVNPSQAAAGSTLLVNYEDFNFTSTALQAASLP